MLVALDKLHYIGRYCQRVGIFQYVPSVWYSVSHSALRQVLWTCRASVRWCWTRLIRCWLAGIVDLSGVSQVVLDEADTLLDDSFREDVRRLLSRLPLPALSADLAQQGASLTLLAATLPPNVDSLMQGLVRVRDDFHYTPFSFFKEMSALYNRES